MDQETRRKIEETVVDILKKTNLEEMTEYKVRATASERLGLDLSETEYKWLVRSVVENFLLSMAEDVDKGKETEPNAPDETNAEELKIVPKKEINDDGSRVICQLSDKRSVTIQDFRGKTLVSIRQYYQKDGKQLPSAKGISLSTEQWSAFRRSIPAIEEAILQMTKRLRSEHEAENIDDISNPLTDETLQKFPFETVRFDGKNYNVWARQMEFLLQRLKIAYILSDPCPSVVLGPGSRPETTAQSKAAEQKWRNDDYICRHNILSSLSDNLFHQYAKKTMSARELWEELKLLFLFEESGTKRSQVKRYMEFMMVEEKSILEQVQEFNDIADSVVAAGMWIDENFHVSVIISKLPPSWKNVCFKLMREEHLPFKMLMDRLRIEEELRTQQKSGLSGMSFVPLRQYPAMNHVSKMGDPKFPSPQLKKREWQMDGKAVTCYTCGKKGHISRNCLNRKADNDGTHERRQQTRTEVHIAEGTK